MATKTKAELEARIVELEAIVAEQEAQLEKLGSKKKAAKEKAGANPFPKISKTKRSKFKCATSGKHACDECGKEIERGDTIRFVDVKYADGTQERFTFCCSKHRNAYCDEHGIPQDKAK